MRSSLTKPSDVRAAAAIRVRGTLSVSTAASLCRAIEAELAAGIGELVIDLRDVKSIDVVGLAVLHQAVGAAGRRRVSVSILADPSLRARALRAELLDELPFATAASVTGAHLVELPDDTPSSGAFLAFTPRLGLRPPSWDELPLFERWANDSLLDQMVGSRLLYHCRQLGPYHDEFVELLLSDPTSITLIVEPLDPPRLPVGFVRLYDINLGQQFGFLETAIASPESLRRGWGVEASRLLAAWTLDVLQLNRVEAKVYAYNILSANALRRSGCQQEGVLRQAKQYGGQRWDILVFSILAEEMRARRSVEEFPYVGLWSVSC